LHLQLKLERLFVKLSSAHFYPRRMRFIYRLGETVLVFMSFMDCIRNANAQDANATIWQLRLNVSSADWASLQSDPRMNDQTINVTLTGFLGSEQKIPPQSAKIELHGQSARQWPKLSYKIGFKPKLRVAGLLGDEQPNVEKISAVVLKSSWVDPLFIREQLVFRATRRLGGLAPRFNLVELYINGEYDSPAP
jgi:hypothetical protein